jgi:hypothetical protein
MVNSVTDIKGPSGSVWAIEVDMNAQLMTIAIDMMNK